MNITFSVGGALEKMVKTHRNVKWTEIARNALWDEAINVRKLEILRKYVERKPITDEDWAWMEETDWHPVDEAHYRGSFVAATKKAASSHSGIDSLKDL